MLKGYNMVLNIATENFTLMDAIRTNNTLSDCGLVIDDMVYDNNTVRIEISLVKDIETLAELEEFASAVKDIVTGNYRLPEHETSADYIDCGSEDLMCNCELEPYKEYGMNQTKLTQL